MDGRTLAVNSMKRATRNGIRHNRMVAVVAEGFARRKCRLLADDPIALDHIDCASAVADHPTAATESDLPVGQIVNAEEVNERVGWLGNTGIAFVEIHETVQCDLNAGKFYTAIVQLGCVICIENGCRCNAKAGKKVRDICKRAW